MNLHRENLWVIAFIFTALGVFAVKIFVASSTAGAPDISAWKDFLANIQNCGVCVYRTGGVMVETIGPRVTPFNHPPFVIHLLRLVGAISNALSVDFALVFRGLTSCFDLGSAILVYKLLTRYGLFTPVRFLLYLVAPATILISGYHGQTDTLMIFFVLLAAFFIEKPVLAGLAFGMALSIKIVPLIFAAAFIFYLPRDQRIKFAAAVVGIGFLLALPYIVQEPAMIAREVLGYRSFPGRWGWSRALFAQTGPSALFWLTTRVAAYLLIAYLWYLSLKMWRKRIPIYTQLSAISFLLIAFTPSWGTNYMSWLDPFAVTPGALLGLGYYVTSGALIGCLYFIDPDESTPLSGLCWFVVLIVTWRFLRLISSFKNHRPQETSQQSSMRCEQSTRNH